MYTVKTKHKKELIDVLQKAGKNPALFEDLLKDLLTPKELVDLIKRWQIIKELHKGTAQRDISDSLHVGVAKVSRGARALLYPSGGFNQILNE